MTIADITIGTNTYKSYATVVEADAQLAVDPVRKATWEALQDDVKGQYLIAATNRLDLLTWLGKKTGGATQLNAWPRSDLKYEDGTDVSTTDAPNQLQRATILLAGSIASEPESADAGSSASNIKKVKAGGADVEFFSSPRVIAGTPLQDETAFTLIKLWLEGTAGSLGNTVTGTDTASTFGTAGQYDRTRGYG